MDCAVMDMVGKEMFVFKKNRIRKIGFCLQYVSLIVSNYKKYYTFQSVWNAREHFLCWKTFLIRKNNLFSKYSLFTFKNCLFCPDTQLEEKWRKSYSCFIFNSIRVRSGVGLNTGRFRKHIFIIVEKNSRKTITKT